jgi:hypothetical protein
MVLKEICCHFDYCGNLLTFQTCITLLPQGKLMQYVHSITPHMHARMHTHIQHKQFLMLTNHNLNPCAIAGPSKRPNNCRKVSVNLKQAILITSVSLTAMLSIKQ